MSNTRTAWALLLALASGPVGPALADSYAVSDPAFRIIFPGTPRRSEKRLPFEEGPVQAQRYVLRLTDAVLLLNYWDFPSLPKDPVRVLDRVGELTVKGSGGPNDPMGESDITLGGFSGREYRFGRRGVIRMVQRTYSVRARVYHLVAASEGDAPVEPNDVVQAFFKSFTLISPK